WYTPNGGVGACGAPLQNSDHIVAFSSDQQCQVHRCHATLGDLCPGCGHNVLDLSSSAFQKLAPLDDGHIKVTWNYD
ncbi:hypothetical protein IW262DRAFT_1273119, partial [Armillaria fumosa]